MNRFLFSIALTVGSWLAGAEAGAKPPYSTARAALEFSHPGDVDGWRYSGYETVLLTTHSPKTNLLVEMGRRFKGRRDVFYYRASWDESTKGQKTLHVTSRGLVQPMTFRTWHRGVAVDGVEQIDRTPLRTIMKHFGHDVLDPADARLWARVRKAKQP